MLPDRVSNPGPLTYESGALPIALRGPARTRLMQRTNQKYVQACFLFASLSLINSHSMYTTVYNHTTMPPKKTAMKIRSV